MNGTPRIPSSRGFFRSGEPFVWLTGGALALSLLMVVGLVGLIVWNGLGYFRPREVFRFTLSDGRVVVGEIDERERIPDPGAPEGTPRRFRIKVKAGNRDVTGADYLWIEEAKVTRRERPRDVVALERREWGAFFGFVREVREGESVVVSGSEAGWKVLSARLREARATVTPRVVMTVADGREKEIPLSAIVRAYRPNALGTAGKARVYLSRLWEFVSADPRESNTEGGVFPAIFGTVMMVFLMTVVVTPLGVLAAFYLREYARQGPFVSAVRIAVNNLAGVPSIVFGVFGLGFFVYFLGGSIDRLFFPEELPTPTFGTGGIFWASLTLSLLTVPVVIVATEEGLAALPRGIREASYALAATKLETMWRVVLPAVMPAVLTGLILAMARAAGEVAPLMITGVVKLAPSLPVDGFWPYLHLDRKFMHLGFHIYDVGFQSPNVDAARPMVYTTTILLLAIIVALNLSAILFRNRLRRKLRTSGL